MVGNVLYQSRPGVDLKPIHKNDCVDSGATLFTGPDGRIHLLMADANIDIFMNSRSGGGFFLEDPAKPKLPSFMFREGEAWIESAQPGQLLIVSPSGNVTAQFPGKFHFLARKQRTYYTSAQGGLTINTPVNRFTVQPGEQIIVTWEYILVKKQGVQLDHFLEWVNAWKNDFRPIVAKKPSSSPTPENPETTDQKSLIIDTVRLNATIFIPKFVTIEVYQYTDKWAIAVTKDSRPEPELKPDFWKQTPILLEKADGHWNYLTEFEDYDGSVFEEWKINYGFTKDDEKALRLSE